MRALLLVSMALCAVFASGTATAQPRSKNTTYALIVCESPRGAYSECPADTRRGVQLRRDLSGRCRMGQTYGYSSRAIWVNGGCAGEFEIGSSYQDDWGSGWGYGYQSDRRIVCASEDYRRQFCPIHTNRGVRLVNQISRAPCVRGRTWWRDANGVVVTEGCAGEFEAGYRDDDYVTSPSIGGGGWVTPSAVRCESRDYHRRYCPADIGNGTARIQRQFSNSQCVQGRTWSFDRRGIWVQNGCAADFAIDYRGGY